MKFEFDGIQFGYGPEPILSGIYVKNETGRITGLLGRNGSGKSTLMKIVFGAIDPGVISVRIDGSRLPIPAFRSRRVSYLPQESFVPSTLTIRKALALYGIEEERITLPFPELKDELGSTSDQLSGGMLRLVECLLILFCPGHFCLLDEPFTGLSPRLIERLEEVIQKEKMNKGIILTDHLYRNVLHLADDIYLLSNGKTYPIKDKEELIRRGYITGQE